MARMWKEAAVPYLEDYATCWTVRGSNPGKSTTSFSSSKRPDRLWGPPSLLFNGHRSSLPGVRRPGRDVDRSPPSSADIKNVWSYTVLPPPPPVYLHGVERDSICLTFYFPGMRLERPRKAKIWPDVSFCVEPKTPGSWWQLGWRARERALSSEMPDIPAAAAAGRQALSQRSTRGCGT
jgi:hypothetical protein